MARGHKDIAEIDLQQLLPIKRNFISVWMGSMGEVLLTVLLAVARGKTASMGHFVGCRNNKTPMDIQRQRFLAFFSLAHLLAAHFQKLYSS